MGLASCLGHNTWDFSGTLPGTTPERTNPHACTISHLLHNSNIYLKHYDTMPLVKRNCPRRYTHRYGTKCQIIGIIPKCDILTPHISVLGLWFMLFTPFCFVFIALSNKPSRDTIGSVSTHVTSWSGIFSGPWSLKFKWSSSVWAGHYWTANPDAWAIAHCLHNSKTFP